SIETLALILSTQTIRFSRADMVNDLEELKIIDLPAMKESVFISCWTASEKESIPLWKMYGSNLKGVRIKLPTDMFRRGSKPYLSSKGNCHLINLLSLENVVQRGKDYQWIPYIFGPTKVNYSQDNSVSVIERNELMVDRIGTVKLEHWKFEEEYRYLIIPDALWNSEEKRFLPPNPSSIEPVDQLHVDIPLSLSAINSIEVTLGPASKDAEHCIVDTLLSKLTKRQRITESVLKGKVRC
ncbi:MAG: DUF2971 domain-containing protein, partial [Deltaproteobacteria bacterium]|nr:DUF2971 domain-containing protein [Deltaproteobacteria bacterium]